jgi:S1-C subfamily serine protease
VHTAGPEFRPRRRSALAVATLGAAVLGAALSLGGAAVLGAFDDPEPIVAPPVTIPPAVQITEIVADGSMTPATAVGLKVVPSIVTVEVGSSDPAGDFRAVGSGSGVVLGAEGAIATNHHVVSDADSVRVIFQDGRIYGADIVGSDELTDLAVLQIDAEDLVPIERGSTQDLVIGDAAIAVGNPLGLSGGASLTVGVVSAFNREVQVGPGASDRLFGMLQTDAPITNGSSGGALVDGEGRLIGITTAIGVSEAGAEGIGFAIPVELVVRITDELIERGDVRHAFLGVGLRDFLERDGSAQVPAGATISNIEPGTSAESFGLLVGDRIVAVDETTVLTTQDVINTLRLYRVGDVARVAVVRDGESLTVEVELGERPEGI